MSGAVLELDFNGRWFNKLGRTLRWRKLPPRQPLGLRVRLEERHGEGVEVEFPAFTGPEKVIDTLSQVRVDFMARFPPPRRPSEDAPKA